MEDCLFMKLLIVGDSAVGKTSIVTRYFSGFFDTQTVPTIGYDFTTKLYSKQNSVKCKLQVWDIAGQERYQAVSKLYARNSAGCIVVCDITNKQSLENTLKWKQIIEDNCGIWSSKSIPFVLVQNKVDLIKEDLLDFMSQNYLKEFAKNNGFVAAIQTSAKLNLGLEEVFDTIVVHAKEIVFNMQKTNEENRNRESLMRISNKYKKEVVEIEHDNYIKNKKIEKGSCCFFN